MRLGTLLRSHGFALTELPEPKRRMNSYDRRLINFDAGRPGIYHPIKEQLVTEGQEAEEPADSEGGPHRRGQSPCS